MSTAQKQMALVFLKQTGHVVGAVTRNAASDDPSPDLIAAGVTVIWPNTPDKVREVTLPQSVLDIKSTKLSGGVLMNLLAYQYATDTDTCTSLASVLTGLAVSNFQSGKLKVSIPAISNKTKLLVHIQGGQTTESRDLTDELAPGAAITKEFDLDPVAHPGDYTVAIFLAGSEPKIEAKNL
jgi:hypothetical protein